jgi:pyruvate dehydrogenase (quinone)/pyruvate oxidase
MKEWWAVMEERGTSSDKPMKPQVVTWELGKRLAPDAIVFGGFRHYRNLVRPTDTSSTRPKIFSIRKPRHHAQWLTLRHRRAGCLSGTAVHRLCRDGGFSMLMAEFATAVKYKLSLRLSL